MVRRKTGEMIGCGTITLTMSLGGVNGLALSLTGHGMMMDVMTGHGMMNGMKALTGVGKVGMEQNRALLQAVYRRLLNGVANRLSSRALSRMSPP